MNNLQKKFIDIMEVFANQIVHEDKYVLGKEYVKINFTKNKKRAGSCNFLKREIKIQNFYLHALIKSAKEKKIKFYKNCKEELWRILLHEIAHLNIRTHTNNIGSNEKKINKAKLLCKHYFNYRLSKRHNEHFWIYLIKLEKVSKKLQKAFEESIDDFVKEVLLDYKKGEEE